MALVTMIDGARAGALHLVTTLGQASLEAAVVGLAVWGVCRLLPGLPAHVRAWLWWLVSLKLLLGLLPVPGIGVPLLPAPAALTQVSPAVHRSPRVPASGTVRDRATTGSSPSDEAQSASTPVPVATVTYMSLWPVALAAAWLALLTLQLRGLARALAHARRLRAEATPVAASIARRATVLVERFALRVMPRARRCMRPRSSRRWRPGMLHRRSARSPGRRLRPRLPPRRRRAWCTAT